MSQKIVEQGIRAWRGSQSAGWITARAAWYVVGGWATMSTSTFAKELSVSPQAVRRWKQAWELYRYLCGQWVDGMDDLSGYPHPRLLRRKVTLDHFTELMELQGKYLFPTRELFAALHTAGEEGISAKAMRYTLEEQATGRATQPQWWRYLSELQDTATKLMGEAHAPIEVRHATATWIQVARDYLEQGDEVW